MVEQRARAPGVYPCPHSVANATLQEVASSGLTAAVRIDSGWNCTPSTSKFAVPDAHDLDGPGIATVQAVTSRHGGQVLALDHQRVVARGLERPRQPAKTPLSLSVDQRGLAVHDARGAHDLSRRRPGRCTGDRGRRRGPGCVRRSARTSLQRDARLVRRAGPRRNDDARGRRRSISSSVIASLRTTRPPRPARPGTAPGCR
jgi:hypothetical protein